MADTVDVFFLGLDAREVSATLPGGTVRTFSAYFDEPFADHALGDGFDMESAGYELTCRASDAAGFVRDETVVDVAGRQFVVVRVRRDGAGIAVVDLIDPYEVTEVRA